MEQITVNNQQAGIRVGQYVLRFFGTKMPVDRQSGGTEALRRLCKL